MLLYLVNLILNMKKRGLVFIVFLILLCSVVLAESRVRFDHIEFDSYVKSGGDMIVRITIENERGRSLNNLKLSAFLIGPDIMDRKICDKITIGQTETTTLILNLDNVDPGVYYLKIMAENNDIRRIKYREVVIV